MSLAVRIDRQLVRSTSHSRRFLLVEVTAPPARPRPGRERPPVNLGFVLDRSGSMSGTKIALARQAVVEGISRLAATDRFSVVVYDDMVDAVVESTPASAEARQAAIERIGAIEARGSTDLGAGYLRGCEQVARQLAEAGVNRCLLLSDGLANRGITDSEELARHAAELRRRGISTTTFGVGQDFDEELLRAMSVSGSGNFYFIEQAPQIPDYIASEVGEALEVTARGATLQVIAPDGLRLDSPSGFDLTSQGTRTTVRLGDLVAEQRVTLLLRLAFPYGEPGRQVGVQLLVEDRDGRMPDGGPVRVAWTYADHAANDGQARDREVDRHVARAFAARARQRAVKLNRMGDFEAARHELTSTARRIREYAGRDQELRAVVAELEREAEAWAMPVAELARKVAFSTANYELRSRDAYGAALRRPPPPDPRGGSRS